MRRNVLKIDFHGKGDDFIALNRENVGERIKRKDNILNK